MEKISEQQVDAILSVFQRDINCLIDQDRNIRKKGITNIQTGLFSKSYQNDVILYVFQANVAQNLFRILEDKVEKLRETAYDVLDQFFAQVEEEKESYRRIDREIIHLLMKILLGRISSIPYPQQSQEMRLLCLMAIQQSIKLFSQELVPLVAELGSGLSQALLDSFPDGKKQASTLVMEVSIYMKSHIGHHALNIVQSLGNNVGHQHFQVRKISIQALVSILLTEGAGQLYEHVLNVFKGSANDKILEVRQSVYQAVAKLLNGFSIANLRSYEADLTLILLNGLNDESTDIIQISQQYLEDCGVHRKMLDEQIQGENKMQEQPAAEIKTIE